MYFRIPNRSSHYKWAITYSTLIWQFKFLKRKLISSLSCFILFFFFINILLLIPFLWFWFHLFSFLIYYKFLFNLRTNLLKIKGFAIQTWKYIGMLGYTLMTFLWTIFYSNKKSYIKVNSQRNEWLYVLLLPISNFIYHSQHYS